jgi:hypothetical protein
MKKFLIQYYKYTNLLSLLIKYQKAYLEKRSKANYNNIYNSHGPRVGLYRIEYANKKKGYYSVFASLNTDTLTNFSEKQIYIIIRAINIFHKKKFKLNDIMFNIFLKKYDFINKEIDNKIILYMDDVLHIYDLVIKLKKNELTEFEQLEINKELKNIIKDKGIDISLFNRSTLSNNIIKLLSLDDYRKNNDYYFNILKNCSNKRPVLLLNVNDTEKKEYKICNFNYLIEIIQKRVSQKISNF